MAADGDLERARKRLRKLKEKRDQLLELRRPRQTLGHPVPDEQLEVLTDEEEAYLQKLLDELIPNASQEVERLEEGRGS